MYQYTRNFAIASILLYAAPLTVSAEAPDIKTEGTVIYLADNLNEEKKLGWCIDTKGRGLSDQLHAHSCKPQGGDTQFSFDEASGKIESVAYEGKCMALSDPENKQLPFGLLDCVKDEENQRFVYDAESMEIRIAADQTQCVAVVDKISNAGPFQSRDLIYAACDALEPAFKQWVIRE